MAASSGRLKIIRGKFELSFAIGLVAAVICWLPVLPNPLYFLSYLDFQLANLTNARFIPRLPVPDRRAKAAELQTRLKAMSDDELILISEAKLPCLSGLIANCFFSDSYVARLAAAELRDRARKRQDELEAQKRQDQIELINNGRMTWLIAGFVALVGVGTFVLGILTYRKDSKASGGAQPPTEPEKSQGSNQADDDSG